MTQYENCQKGWCYTKIFSNDSAYTGEWGYCNPKCSSMELEQPYYNLASKMHSDLWDEHIFMLDKYSPGHCHTYNPHNNSFPRVQGQLYAMLGIMC